MTHPITTGRDEWRGAVTPDDWEAALVFLGWTHRADLHMPSAKPAALEADRVAQAFARHRLAAEASFKAREDALVEALEDVVNPLAYLQRYAEARGNNLGPQAYNIANNLAFVQGITRDALLARAHTAAEGERPNA